MFYVSETTDDQLELKGRSPSQCLVPYVSSGITIWWRKCCLILFKFRDKRIIWKICQGVLEKHKCRKWVTMRKLGTVILRCKWHQCLSAARVRRWVSVIVRQASLPVMFKGIISNGKELVVPYFARHADTLILHTLFEEFIFCLSIVEWPSVLSVMSTDATNCWNGLVVSCYNEVHGWSHHPCPCALELVVER